MTLTATPRSAGAAGHAGTRTATGAAAAGQPAVDAGACCSGWSSCSCVIGLVMVLSASSVQSLREYGSAWYYFVRQLLWIVARRSSRSSSSSRRRLPRWRR